MIDLCLNFTPSYSFQLPDQSNNFEIYYQASKGQITFRMNSIVIRTIILFEFEKL